MPITREDEKRLAPLIAAIKQAARERKVGFFKKENAANNTGMTPEMALAIALEKLIIWAPAPKIEKDATNENV